MKKTFIFYVHLQCTDMYMLFRTVVLIDACQWQNCYGIAFMRYMYSSILEVKSGFVMLILLLKIIMYRSTALHSYLY